VGIGLGVTIKCMRCTTSGAAGNGLGPTIKYLCGAAGIGLGIMIKYLRRTTSAAADYFWGTSAKYLRRKTSGIAGNGLSRYRGLLMCPFTTSAPHSPFLRVPP
jgi:hypothetical protein